MARAHNVVTSSGKLFGINTVTGEDGTAYMTRAWFGHLRLHIFHRPDHDEDCHDHPWDFTTFPIWPVHGYVEEVVRPVITHWAKLDGPFGYAEGVSPSKPEKSLQVVPAFRLTHRKAEHCHRVIGAYAGYDDLTLDGLVDWVPVVNSNRKIITLVWKGDARRAWGFLKNREGKWCWIAWRDYVFAGGKDGPCQ